MTNMWKYYCGDFLYGKYLKYGRSSVNSCYSFIISSSNIVMVMMVMMKDTQDLSLHCLTTLTFSTGPNTPCALGFLVSGLRSPFLVLGTVLTL